MGIQIRRAQDVASRCGRSVETRSFPASPMSSSARRPPTRRSSSPPTSRAPRPTPVPAAAPRRNARRSRRPIAMDCGRAPHRPGQTRRRWSRARLLIELSRRRRRYAPQGRAEHYGAADSGDDSAAPPSRRPRRPGRVATAGPVVRRRPAPAGRSQQRQQWQQRQPAAESGAVERVGAEASGRRPPVPGRHHPALLPAVDGDRSQLGAVLGARGPARVDALGHHQHPRYRDAGTAPLGGLRSTSRFPRDRCAVGNWPAERPDQLDTVDDERLAGADQQLLLTGGQRDRFGLARLGRQSVRCPAARRRWCAPRSARTARPHR